MVDKKSRRVRPILFRIFYSTSFTTFALLTLAFVFASPIDTLYQSYKRNRLIDMFIIGGVYVVTLLIGIFLYSTRIYSNRSGMREIPRGYMPLDKAEIGGRGKVYRMIVDGRDRSVMRAFIGKPRATRIEMQGDEEKRRALRVLKPELEEHSTGRKKKSTRAKIYNKEQPHIDEHDLGYKQPEWTTTNNGQGIAHRGWASPARQAEDNLVGLEYSKVVCELLDLIEARAVSLAPASPHSQDAKPDQIQEPEVDEYTVQALTRPLESGMRQYISQLVSLGVLENDDLLATFITLYERARFAPLPLSDAEFKTLMRVFAELLRGIKSLDLSALDAVSDVDTNELGEPGDTEDDMLDHDNNTKPDLKGKAASRQTIRDRIGQLETSSKSDSSASLNDMLARHNNVRLLARAASISSLNGQEYPESSIDDHDRFQDASDMAWAAPTSRPPFLATPEAQDSRKRPNRINRLASKVLGRDKPQSSDRLHASFVNELPGSRKLSYSSQLQESTHDPAMVGRVRSRPSFESSRSHGSRRSGRSNASSGSVIRLARNDEEVATGLPYVIELPSHDATIRQSTSEQPT